MVAKIRFVVAGLLLVVVVVVLWLMGVFGRFGIPDPFHEITEREQVRPAEERFALFADDKLEDKNPAFDPDLIDNRSFGEDTDNQWQINASAAVMGLDMLDIRDSDEEYLLQLYPSYAAAVAAVRQRGETVLPSINMLDGKAKQFDDGLYAELDAAVAARKMQGFHDTSDMVKAIMAKLDRSSDACAWLWGGLKIGGFLSETELKTPPARASAFIDEFDANELESKPIGFYTWSAELKTTFRFLRYFQKKWVKRVGVPDQIAAVLAANGDVMAQYERMLDFYTHLTNPFEGLSFQLLADPANAGKSIRQISSEKRIQQPAGGPGAFFLPYSRSKEVTLFNRVFPLGLPEDADLMMELVRAIRDGKVDLKPRAESGWYDYQVYALETFLLPERGEEHEKLLLKKKYKERMLQAFAAMITKRRETHARQLAWAGDMGAAPPPEKPIRPLRPRLRVEPNPTFFLRTARAYAFLQAYLESVVPDEVMQRLRGRKEGGERAMPLAQELTWTKDFFYGLHLVSCEDIGMKPQLMADEPVDREACVRIASDWLANWPEDPDLAVDTRVAIPIYTDSIKKRTQLWLTLGVRGAKLSAWYATFPKWRPAAQAGPAAWQDMEESNTASAEFIILVDEFGEVQRKWPGILTREELRRICDRQGTKEEILRALARE